MDAPQRPKLWLLRTRRFWLGFGMLCLLVSVWLFSPGCIASAVVNQSVIQNGMIQVRFAGVYTEEGLIGLCSGSDVGELGLHDDLPDTFEWKFKQDETARLSFIPTHWIVNVTDAEQKYSRKCVGAPLWLPVLLWLIIWPLWMRRLTRKEAAHFAKLR